MKDKYFYFLQDFLDMSNKTCCKLIDIYFLLEDLKRKLEYCRYYTVCLNFQYKWHTRHDMLHKSDQKLIQKRRLDMGYNKYYQKPFCNVMGYLCKSHINCFRFLCRFCKLYYMVSKFYQKSKEKSNLLDKWLRMHLSKENIRLHKNCKKLLNLNTINILNHKANRFDLKFNQNMRLGM